MPHQPANEISPRVEFQVHFRTGQYGRRHLREGDCRKEPYHPDKTLPRLTRLLALAHRWNRLIEEGAITDYAEIARTMGLSRARVTQIMDLLYLAPEIQEEILSGKTLEPVSERAARTLIRIPEWEKQCAVWRKSEL
jgi:hypothetical protein